MDSIGKWFRHYRKQGFPYPQESQEVLQRDFDALTAYPSQRLWRNPQHLKRVNIGARFLNHYMRHIWRTRARDKMSVVEGFNDNKTLKHVLSRILRAGEKVTGSRLRRYLRTTSGVQGVYNFRPTVAKYIYDTYLPNAGTIYDFSAGYGGRLLGALSSSKVKHYVGTDPCTTSYTKLVTIKEEWADKQVTLYNKPAEDIQFSIPVHLVFTSPPYFNTEEYSYEPTQSFIRYPNPKDWIQYFLFASLDTAISSLVTDGYLIINIKDIPAIPELVFTVFKYLSPRVRYIETLFMCMRSANNIHNTEPIFIFKKE